MALLTQWAQDNNWEKRRRPRVGETWEFQMQAPSGRMVWWTRKLTAVTAEGCYWHEPRRWLRSCTTHAVVLSGKLIASPNAS